MRRASKPSSRAETSSSSRSGTGSGCVGSAHRAVGAERPRQLERVERIPARRLVQPEQRRPGQAMGEQAAQDLMRRADAERPTGSARPCPSRASSTAVDCCGSPSRRVQSNEMSASGNRRSANPTALADEASSHCRSSIAITSPSSASSSRALRTATPSARWSTPPSGASSISSATSRPGAAARSGPAAPPRERRRTGRQGRRGQGRAPTRPAATESTRSPRARAVLDRGAPERRLPDPGVALQGDRDRALACAHAGRETRTERRAPRLCPRPRLPCSSSHRDRRNPESQPESAHFPGRDSLPPVGSSRASRRRGRRTARSG